jgi:hypothetical protein
LICAVNNSCLEASIYDQVCFAQAAREQESTEGYRNANVFVVSHLVPWFHQVFNSSGLIDRFAMVIILQKIKEPTIPAWDMFIHKADIGRKA